MIVKSFGDPWFPQSHVELKQLKQQKQGTYVEIPSCLPPKVHSSLRLLRSSVETVT